VRSVYQSTLSTTPRIDLHKVPPAFTWIPSEVPPWTLTDSTNDALAITAVQIAAPLFLSAVARGPRVDTKSVAR
jgi:hypothetical protein